MALALFSIPVGILQGFFDLDLGRPVEPALASPITLGQIKNLLATIFTIRTSFYAHVFSSAVQHQCEDLRVTGFDDRRVPQVALPLPAFLLYYNSLWSIYGFSRRVQAQILGEYPKLEASRKFQHFP